MKTAALQKADTKNQGASSLFIKNENKSSAETNETSFEYANGPAFNFGNINIRNYGTSWIQPKLQINQPGDQYEQEADAMADKVMRMKDLLAVQQFESDYKSANFKEGRGEIIKRKCTECEKEDEEKKVHRKENNNSPPSISPSLVNYVLSSSTGNTMEDGIRTFMESRFNRDFSRVKIHDDDLSAKSARSINALAYTHGNNIVFNAGKYAPNSESGKRLLAHELTHVVQQMGPGAHHTSLNMTKTSVVQRQPGDLPPSITPLTTPPRIVYIDANVLDQINRGNAEAAQALLKLKNSGADLRISQQAYNESVVSGPNVDAGTGPNAQTAAANRLLLDEMGIKLGPSTPFSQRVDAYAKNVSTSKSGNPIVSEPDIRVIAESKAAGEGELWTFDRVARTNPGNIEKPFGIKLAPETTTINPVKGVGNYKIGRQLLGLKSVEISNTGVVTRAPANQVAGSETAPVEVQTTINVTKSTTNPDGSVVSEVEIKFSQNIADVNSAAPASNTIPGNLKFRLTQNADGTFLSAEPLQGEATALVEAIGRQMVAEASQVSGAAAGSSEGAAAAGAAEGSAPGVAQGASKVAKALPYIHKGLKWGGPAVFIIITGYQLVTAAPKDRPKVLVKAGGGFLGGMGVGFLVCNLALDLETAGGGIIICGILAGGAGGYLGSEAAGDIYDAANPPPGLTEMEQALLNMEHQPNNVKALFYTMINQKGASGIPITPEFINQFIFTVPADLAIDELYLLAGQLKSVSSTDTLQSIIDNLSHAVYDLPRRKINFRVLPPKLNTRDILELDPLLRYRIEAPGSGTIKVFPDYRGVRANDPNAPRQDFNPILEIRIPGT